MWRMMAVAVVLLAMPASAQATTVTNVGGTLTYTGAAGENNVVAFTQSGMTVTVSDNDVTTATGCTGTSPTFSCMGVGTVIANANDGDDTLDASGLTTARATLSGGDGIDTVIVAGDPVSISLNDAADDGTAGQRLDIRSDIEDVDATAAGAATLVGSDSGNVITAGSGPAKITGGAGFDELIGGTGADTIDARDGYGDRVSCGPGTDKVTADQLDQVAADCENVTRENFVGGADDRPPVVAWTMNATSLSADKPTTLTATATDDRGVAKVQFLDDDRLVCEDTTAPYTCDYQARGGDVGRNTLIARAIDTADQATSAIQAVTVRRFSAKGLTLKLNPTRDTRAPYRFRVTGNLMLPPTVSRTQGCQGSEVAIIVKAGRKIVATRRLTLSRVCGYQRRIDFSRRPGTRPRFTAKFLGNDVVQPISAPSRTGRTA